jgi:manganese transport protein
MATDDHTHARGSQSSGASSPNSTTAMLPSRISDARKDAAVIIEDSSSIDVELDQQSGWHSQRATLSLPEAHATIKMPAQASASPWRMMLAFAGCGTIISVGYMDPGNWATGLAGGAKFGYSLLFVILVSNILAMFLQHLALKLGVASGRDLAQACRDAYPRWVCYPLWVMAEVAIAACDLAEVIGAAVALQLLFGLPLWAGVLITIADVALVMLLEGRGFRWLEVFIIVLILIIFGCFVYEMAVAQPNWLDVGKGFVPTGQLFTNPDMLYSAIGILGATVMPHNLYLHSAVIQTRAWTRCPQGRRAAIKYGTLDSSLSLLFAFLINASILILAGAAFYYGGDPHRHSVDIQDAYKLLSPTLGAKAASVIFALALLASGQNSTITGTLAGQVVMEGFLDLKMRPVFRRLLTRAVAVVPALIVAAVMGDKAVGQLLVISQVILSMQLPFAVFPLVQFTSRQKFTGRYANGWVSSVFAVVAALLIAGLNVYLLISIMMDPKALSGA